MKTIFALAFVLLVGCEAIMGPSVPDDSMLIRVEMKCSGTVQFKNEPPISVGAGGHADFQRNLIGGNAKYSDRYVDIRCVVNGKTVYNSRVTGKIGEVVTVKVGCE